MRNLHTEDNSWTEQNRNINCYMKNNNPKYNNKYKNTCSSKEN